MSHGEIDISSVPYDEEALQVGSVPYLVLARQAHIYKRQLLRKYPIPNSLKPHIKISVVKNYHDFGSYPSIRVTFNEGNSRAIRLAFRMEAGMSKWDDIAIKELENINSNEVPNSVFGVDIDDLPDGCDIEAVADGIENGDYSVIF